MKNLPTPAATATQFAVVALCTVAILGCSKSLNSIEGPASGTVTGLVCDDLAVLSAAVEIPAIQSSLIQEGKCLHLRSRIRVEFVRTVMMPGDGKYSQFEYSPKEKTLKLWIKTSRVSGA